MPWRMVGSAPAPEDGRAQTSARGPEVVIILGAGTI